MKAARTPGPGGKRGIVGRQADQLPPPSALRLRDRQTEVLGNHARVAAKLLRIGGGAAEDLRQPNGHMAQMVVRHVREQRLEEVVPAHALIEGRGQALEGLRPTRPLIERRNRVAPGHAQKVSSLSSAGTSSRVASPPARQTVTPTARPISSAVIIRCRSAALV